MKATDEEKLLEEYGIRFNPGREAIGLSQVDSRRDKQGKCEKCATHYIWNGKSGLKLSEAHCPKCGDALQRTVYTVKLPTAYCTVNVKALIIKAEAVEFQS